MQLGLFVDLRRLEASPRSFAEHTSRVIDLLVEAERLGAGSAWFTEHHGFADGYLPQPLVLAAAVAARTSTLRLGTGIILAPLRHARHVAEESAMVDVISNGRLELGLGAGYAAGEFAMFGAELEQRFRSTDALAVEVRRLLASGEVTPGPVQQPLPIWLGYQGPQGAKRAGRMGFGLLSLDRRLYEPYTEGLVEGGHDVASTARMGGLVDLIVADDPEAATERLIPHWLHQTNTYRALMTGPDGAPLAPVSEEKARAGLAKSGRLGGLQVVDVNGAVAELQSRTEGLPAEHAYSWLSLADMPDDLVERHLELWCGPVSAAVASADR